MINTINKDEPELLDCIFFFRKDTKNHAARKNLILMQKINVLFDELLKNEQSSSCIRTIKKASPR